MLKIFMPILIIFLPFRNFNVAHSKKLTVRERVAAHGAVPTPPRVMTKQQIEREISFSEIDGNRPFHAQIMSPSSISYTKIKGGWIDIEQLTSR